MRDMPELTIKHNLKIEPYHYQQQGIAKGLKLKRFINGDEPGLGKTFQAAATVDIANSFPCLVICPSSLKINWQREFEKFTHRKALVLNDSVKTTWNYLLEMKTYDVAIVNYESLKKFFVWDVPKKNWRLKDVVFSPYIRMFKSVIIDESHRVKEVSAQQTKFSKGICMGKEYVILLSGTPVVNRPADLISQLAIMDRLKEFGGVGAFSLNYCSGDKEASNLEELQKLLYEKCFFRREKKEVLTELPEKTRCDIYTDITNREEYDVAFVDLEKYLREYKQATEWEIKRKLKNEALVKFMALRGICAKGKVKYVIDYVRDFTSTGKKLILFCALHEIVDELKKAFPKALSVTGRDSATMKQYAVDAFQNDDSCKLIICSIKAAGVGLTLTAASDVAFIEFPWTYADCCQCEDRAHRIGAKYPVTCRYFLGQGTVDGRIYNMIQSKRNIANMIMGANDDIPEDSQYFNELIKSIT